MAARLPKLFPPGNGPAALLGLLMVLALGLLRSADPPPLVALREGSFDYLQRLRPRLPEQPVMLVAIDEASRERYGQWPWPRDRVAELVDKVAAEQPLALGVDLIFFDRDRYSPENQRSHLEDLPTPCREALGALPRTDERLAASLARAAAVVGIGMEAKGEQRSPPSGLTPTVRVVGELPQLLRLTGVLRQIPQIDQAAHGHGLLMRPDEPDGIVRKLPLLAHLDPDEYLPGMPLEVLRVASRVPILTASRGRANELRLQVGATRIDIAADGQLWVQATPSMPQRMVSARALLEGKHPGLLRNRLVLIGTTQRYADRVTSPLGPTISNLEFHAQALEQLYELRHGRPLLRRPGWAPAAERLFSLGAGIFCVLITVRLRGRYHALPPLLTAPLCVLVPVLCYLGPCYLIDPTYPLLSVLLPLPPVVAFNIALMDRTRMRLETALFKERAEKARMEGELHAARRIQMGILPQKFPAFPDRQDFDLHAMIEPAREVGGDLYDFFLVEDNRLFFMIGDVSGKGMPAALFMALTKALYKSSVLRRRIGIGEIMSEAGQELIRENPEMLFVTVFAGILDLTTGELEYANAGHEPPLLLRPGKDPERVEIGGGPPLCAVDGFQYPSERLQLQVGDCLLLFTDGVSEAKDLAGELFSMARIKAALHGAAAADGPKQYILSLYRAVQSFASGAEPADDITLLAVRRNAPPAGSSEGG